MKRLFRGALCAVLLVSLLCALALGASAAALKTTVGIVTPGGGLRLRAEPSTSARTLATAHRGDTVAIIARIGDWYRVSYNSQTGYMSAEYLTVRANGTVELTSAGAELADYAVQLVGSPYVYGGSSPSGFDCSGFMQYVFAQFGYSINRTATAQLSDGVPVDYDELQPGDIVYFGYGSTATHVGMYIGDGQFVHAQNSSTGVVISSLSEPYYASRYLCAHRITG